MFNIESKPTWLVTICKCWKYQFDLWTTGRDNCYINCEFYKILRNFTLLIFLTELFKILVVLIFKILIWEKGQSVSLRHKSKICMNNFRIHHWTQIFSFETLLKWLIFSKIFRVHYICQYVISSNCYLNSLFNNLFKNFSSVSIATIIKLQLINSIWNFHKNIIAQL